MQLFLSDVEMWKAAVLVDRYCTQSAGRKHWGNGLMVQQNEFDHIIMVLSVSGCTCECVQPSAELSVELHVVASVLVFFIECR